MLNRHFLHKGIEYSNSSKFMSRYLMLVLMLTLGIKLFHIVANQYPYVPALFNLPFNVVHSPDYPVKHGNSVIAISDKTQLSITSNHHSAALNFDLGWEPEKIITRGNCFAFRIDNSNPIKLCEEDNVLRLERNDRNDFYIKSQPHPVDVAFLDTVELYVGNGNYLSLTSIGNSETLKYSSGVISEVLNVMVSLFHVCVDYYGIPGLFLSIFIIRSFSFYHDIYQAKLHVYRVLNVPKDASSWKLGLTTIGVITCTILIIQSLFHLDLSIPLETSWKAIVFCYAAICFRLYLQGSKLISIEGIALTSIVTIFALMESSIPGYFFHYFGFCTILIGAVRYLASHYYVRTLNRKFKQC